MTYLIDEKNQVHPERKIADFGSSNIFEVSQKGTVFTLNQFFRYINRGVKFSAYSLYDYTAIVRHKRGVSPATKPCAKKSTAGRPKLEVYPYEGSDETGCPDSSFGQTISSKITIPIIPGPAPPSYPGDKPLLTDFIDSNTSKDKSRKEFDRALSEWTKSAKLFAEFYSILFLPWDAKLDPRDPTMPSLKILP